MEAILRYDIKKIKDDKVLAKVMTEQRAAATIIMQAQVRVDDAQLRGQRNDRIESLLERIKAEKALTVDDLY